MLANIMHAIEQKLKHLKTRNREITNDELLNYIQSQNFKIDSISHFHIEKYWTRVLNDEMKIHQKLVFNHPTFLSCQ